MILYTKNDPKGSYVSSFLCFSTDRVFLLQVLKYLDYAFTGVFTFEMVIKVQMQKNTHLKH